MIKPGGTPSSVNEINNKQNEKTKPSDSGADQDSIDGSTGGNEMDPSDSTPSTAPVITPGGTPSRDPTDKEDNVATTAQTTLPAITPGGTPTIKPSDTDDNVAPIAPTTLPTITPSGISSSKLSDKPTSGKADDATSSDGKPKEGAKTGAGKDTEKGKEAETGTGNANGTGAGTGDGSSTSTADEEADIVASTWTSPSAFYKGVYFAVVVCIIFILLSMRDCLTKNRSSAGEVASQVEYSKLGQKEDNFDVESGMNEEETWEEDWTDLPESSPQVGYSNSISLSSSRSNSAQDFAPSSSSLGMGGVSSSIGTGSGAHAPGSSSSSSSGSGRIGGLDFKPIGSLDLPHSTQRTAAPDSRSSSTPPVPRVVSKRPPVAAPSDTDFFAVRL